MGSWLLQGSLLLYYYINIEHMHHVFNHEVTDEYRFRQLFILCCIVRMAIVPRNLLLLPPLQEQRKRLKLTIAYCLSGAKDVVFLLLLLFCIGFLFAGVGLQVDIGCCIDSMIL